MPFIKLKTGALSLYPYNDVDNSCITSQKLARFLYLLLLLLFNKYVDINKSTLIRLYILCEFLCRLLCNCGAEFF
jgi:hypothetical protein